jgi:hypothetical protein
MSEVAEVRGRVTYESQGQPDAEVLALDAAGGVVASATTGPDGSFVLRPPEGIEPAQLFARCRGPIAGVVTDSVNSGAAGEVELRMDAHGKAWPLEIRLTNEERLEHDPFVRLLPLAVGDIAPETMRLVLATVGEAAQSALESRAMSGGAIDRQVQAGRWWFRVDLAEAWEARPIDAGESTTWISDGAWDEQGTPLQALRGGYEVEVNGPTRVRVHLSPVKQASD